MPVYLCLLRGINVGGKRLKMGDVRDMFASLGIPDSQTLLASGNVVFRSDEMAHDRFVEIVEAAIQSRFGFESKIIMRTHNELQAIIENNPFQGNKFAGNTLLVTFLRSAPDANLIENFNEWHKGVERVRFVGGEIYTNYVEGVGRSKLSHNVIERKLNVIGTARNWNTVLKLLALADEVATS